MAVPLSTEARDRAAKAHVSKMTRAARGFALVILVGAVGWVLLVALAIWVLGLAP